MEEKNCRISCYQRRHYTRFLKEWCGRKEGKICKQREKYCQMYFPRSVVILASWNSLSGKKEEKISKRRETIGTLRGQPNEWNSKPLHLLPLPLTEEEEGSWVCLSVPIRCFALIYKCWPHCQIFCDYLCSVIRILSHGVHGDRMR